MKKAFNLKFLALSALLIAGNLVAWAAAPAKGPAGGTAVGATIKGAIATYRVVADNEVINGLTYKTGWDETNQAYRVKITGLDADGLDKLSAKELANLEIPVTFEEKFGEEYYKYYVVAIEPGLDGSGNKQSFYGYSQITGLKFVDAPKNEDGTPGTAVVTLGGDVSYTVGDRAFYGCTGMRSLVFTTNCEAIGEYAFQNTAIRKFVIPQGCARIGKYAFYECGYLTDVEVAEGNTAMHKLGTYVFGKSSLENLDLRNAEQLWTIEGTPFMHELNVANDVLKRVLLPTSLKAINTAFANCTALEGFGLAPDATGYDANNNPGDLDKTSLGLPADVPTTDAPAGQGIINGAFAGCRKLAELNFPNCDIADQPFAGCVALSKITFVPNYDKTIGTTYKKAETNLFGNCNVNDADYETKYQKTQKALKEIIFKGAFRGTIADNAFVGVKGLTTVNFNGGLQYGATINAAFTDVETLTTVNFNGIDTWNQLDNDASKDDKDVTIKAGAFQNIGVSTLNFGDIKLGYAKAASVTIEGDAFNNNKNLTEVTFGNTENRNFTGSVTIADNAFAEGNVALATVKFGKITTKKSKTSSFLIGSATVDPTYAKTTDGTVVTGKTYYTKSGEEYTQVETPDDSEIGNYYEQTDAGVVGSTVFGDGKALKTVTFAIDADGNKQDVIASTFNIGQNAFASTGLETVTFGNIKAVENKVSTFAIEKNAFNGGDTNNKTVIFGNISDNGTSGSGKLTAKIDETAFAADKLFKVSIGDITATKLNINEAAFQGKTLTDVNIGNITASALGNSEVTIAENAFQGGEVNNKFVVIGEISDKVANTLKLDIKDHAFAADKLYQVLIAYDEKDKKSIAASEVTIGEGAFQGKSLQMVQIGNITTGKADATVAIGKDAFQGGEVTHKTVKIVRIVDGEGKLTATIGENAFAGKLLDKLTIGDMTAKTITIFGDNAFANTSEDVKQDEVISLGKLGAGLDISGATVFLAPKAAGSTYDVTIAGITGDVKIADNTFVAPGDGKASYTFTGDITATSLAGVKAGAFQGSQKWEKGAAVDNTTKVWFQGDYNCEFNATPTFTNVSDLIIAVSAKKDADGKVIGLDKAKNYNVAGALGRFAGFKTVTIGNIPKGKYVNGYYSPQNDNIEEVTFFGSVEGSIDKFYSKKIRKIDFKNVDQAKVLVVEGAVKAEAFQAAAADAASKNEDITVRYYEGNDDQSIGEVQTREAYQIFAKTAFGTAKADAQSVTLYTTPWAKTNVFEDADKKDSEKMAVYRLKYSASEVAPGDPVIAKVVKKEGNTYAYGKLFIPKGVGMKYKVKADYDETSKKNKVQLYYGRIDNSNNEIMMYNLAVIDGYFWIDATEIDQVLVARTNTELKSEMEVEAEPVTAAEDAIMSVNDEEHYYFNKVYATQNQLRYATQNIIHSTLMDNAEFKDRNVYYMANPAKHGFGFVQFDKSAKYKNDADDYSYMAGDFKPLVKGSLYIVGKEQTNAPELKVVFVDEENTDENLTGIDEVKAENQNSDAIYNLQGVRVNNAQKGIYIMNGKKVVIK